MCCSLQSFCLVGCLAMAFGVTACCSGMAVMALGASANIGLVGVIAGAYPAGQDNGDGHIQQHRRLHGMVASPALFGILLDWDSRPALVLAAAALLMLFLPARWQLRRYRRGGAEWDPTPGPSPTGRGEQQLPILPGWERRDAALACVTG